MLRFLIGNLKLKGWDFQACMQVKFSLVNIHTTSN